MNTHKKASITLLAASLLVPSLRAEDGETKKTSEAVQGFVNTYCIKCHSNEKKKGGLNMASYDTLMAGGKHQSKGKPTVSAGKSGESLLTLSMALPLDDEDHMPPEEKAQPTKEEIAFIKWWIDDGAKKDVVIKDAGMEAEIQKTAVALAGKSSAPAAAPKDAGAGEKKKEKEEEEDDDDKEEKSGKKEE